MGSHPVNLVNPVQNLCCQNKLSRVCNMEKRYGKADRIWIGDRGMMSEKNINFLKQSKRR